MTRIARFKRHAGVALLITVVIASATNTWAQTATPSTPSEASSHSVQLDPAGVGEIHARETDLRSMLQMLSTEGRKNIVATKEVQGKVTADLYGVSFREALEAILRSTGHVYEEKGNFIYVYTPEQLTAIKLAERKSVTKVFYLSYITAADAGLLVRAAMSPDGVIATTPAALTGVEMSDVDAGGDAYATQDLLVVTDYEENIAQVAEVIKTIDVKPEMVLIEATILKASLTENNLLGINLSTLSGIELGALNTTITAGTDFARPTSGALSVGITGSQVQAFIDALETVSDVTILANPKLTVVNKQRGEFLVIRREGYVTATVSETLVSETVEFLETGTKLIVRPYIAKNGFIRLDVHPEDSSGEVTLKGAIALPEEDTTKVTSNVLVRDGHTVVIGGMFREQTTHGRGQVPVLGNIPYVGALFRRTDDEIKREEVIVLITPHIIKHDPDEGVSEQLKDEVERFRIGGRKGLRWWGRNRLAESHMRWARQALSAGQLDKAMWNVDMALSMNPRLLEAIHLKERLTNQAYWADESRCSAAKNVIQHMVMQELGKPVERIVTHRKPRNADNVEADVRKELGITKRHEDPLIRPNGHKRAVQPID